MVEKIGMEYAVTTISPEQTFSLGKHLGGLLKGGDVVCLFGGLGAGKTALAQGVGEGLGVRETLTSPTFTLMQEYAAGPGQEPLRLVHMDLYRLNHPEEAEVIGVEDQFQFDSVCLVEWPEIALSLFPDDRLDIVITGNGNFPRRFVFRTHSPEWVSRWSALTGGGQ